MLFLDLNSIQNKILSALFQALNFPHKLEKQSRVKLILNLDETEFIYLNILELELNKISINFYRVNFFINYVVHTSLFFFLVLISIK